MAREVAPPDIVALAEARASARRLRDWVTADRLRSEIESAGWTVVDAGTAFSLRRLRPVDVVEPTRTRYGSSASVPTRLDEAPVGLLSVVLVASAAPGELERALRGLVDHGPDGTQLVVVANDPSAEAAAAFEDLDATDPGAPGVMTEVVWTTGRLNPAAQRNAAIRRARAPIVILLDPGVEATGDLLTPLVAALEDPAVAAAGPFGLVSADVRRFRAAPAGGRDVDALELGLIAFRRSDYLERGPLDERIEVDDVLAPWWSLVLRDGGPGAPARRAVQLDTLPLVRRLPAEERAADDRDRLWRRSHYRYLKRFAIRRDLLTGSAPGDGGHRTAVGRAPGRVARP